YVIISALEVLALKIAGMSLYDALCHMFATMSTGGFSTRDASVGAFNNPIYEIIIIFFMFISGTNFALNYRLIFKGDVKCFYKDPEFKFYTGVVLVSTLLITYNTYAGHIYNSILSALRFSSFQVVSIVTTTGFTTADFDKWPDLSRFLLLALMFVGGCAGSTGGAIKNIRILLLIKHGIREIFRLIHPKAVIPVRLGKSVVSEEIMNSITAFFFLYMGLFTLSTIIMASLGVDLVTSIASTAATIGNIGPGLAKVGASQNYIHIPYIGKIVLILNMVIGRLEIYTILVLIMPGLWKK
ncbi:MAG TPA: TrkH family potassium uptake protein, partial [Candidatus Atribacteria bacterium]|nr:TrkH family potassium uptake protein [Candidatus Atribacteria bacterium]